MVYILIRTAEENVLLDVIRFYFTEHHNRDGPVERSRFLLGLGGNRVVSGEQKPLCERKAELGRGLSGGTPKQKCELSSGQGGESLKSQSGTVLLFYRLNTQ